MSAAGWTSSLLERLLPQRPGRAGRNGHDGAALPERARAALLAFSRRRTRLALLNGVFLAVAVGLAMVLASCLIDRLWPLSSSIRLLLLTVNVALVLVIALRPLPRLFRTPHQRLLCDAQHLEGLMPALREQLITLASHDPRQAAPSAALIQELGRQVEAALQGAKIRSLLPASALRPSLMPAAGAVLLTLVLGCWPWLDLPALAARYVLPLSDRPPVTTTRLMVEPGNAHLIVGQPLQIVVHARHLGDGGGVKVHLGCADGASRSGEVTATMTPVTGDAASFVYTVPSVERDLSYTVTGGDARSQRYLVRALRPPGVLELRGTIHPPSYVRAAEPQAFSSVDGKLEALRGSRIDLDIVASEPLRSAQIILSDQRIPTKPTDQPNVRRATITVDRNAPVRLELLSRENVPGTGPAGARLRALPDHAPTERWDVPSPIEFQLRPRDRLELPYEASDDIALASLEAAVSVNGTPTLVLPLRVASGVRSVDGVLELPMGRLDADIGDIVELHLKAVDGAGQVTRGSPCRVFISPSADDLESRERLAALADASASAGQIATLCEHARQALDQQQPSEARDDAAAPYATAAAESGAQAVESMLRAVARTDDPAGAVALARMIDTIQQRQSRLETPESHRGGTIDDARASASEIAAGLRVLWQGERAAQALAELEDAQAWDAGPATRPASSAPPSSQPATAPSSRRMINQLRRDARKAAAELGIELPATGPVGLALTHGLRQRVERVRSFASSQSPVDFDLASRAWVEQAEARVGFWQRLLAASRAEALSKRGDPSWARDLQLASRAAQRIDETLALDHPDVRGGFALAMAALKAEHDLNLAPAKAKASPDADRSRATAEAARRQMRAWAAASATTFPTSPTTSPTPRSSELAALEANAALAAAARAMPTAKVSPRLTATAPSVSTSGPSTTPFDRSPESSQAAAARVEALDHLEQRQRQLRLQTTRRNLATRPALAEAQAALADDVARQAREAEGLRAGADLQKLREARQKLAQIESSLQQAPSTAPATSPSGDAPKAAAAAQLADTLSSVAEAQAASRVIEKQLVPALSEMQQLANQSPPTTKPASGAPSGGGTGGGAKGTAAGAAARARQAIQQARRALTQAEQALAGDAPLTAAAQAARDAESAMQRSDAASDRAAHVAQDKAAALLAEARRRELAEAARARLQDVPALAALLRPGGGSTSGAAVSGVARDGPVRPNALPREWGRLRERTGADSNAPAAQADPPEFQEALRAYFKALNRQQVNVERR